MPLDYYLALLQLHIAIVGLVIAGIVALVQLLNNAKPQRDIHLLVQRRILVAYGGLLVGLLVILAFGSWASAFPEQAANNFGSASLNFFNDGRIALIIIILSLASLVWFTQLALKTRTLLDSRLYLHKYVARMSAAEVRTYLAAIYSEEKPSSSSFQTKNIPFDPFQPIREYIKDNAFKYYDYGTADGLKHFGNLFDKALRDTKRREKAQHYKNNTGNQAEYIHLARYISESAVEFFAIFAKTASEKRKMDAITLLYNKGELLQQAGQDASLLPIVRGLENIAKLSDDDDEIIAAIERIHQLCDTYLENHRRHGWDHVAGPFGEICLSVTRITETYYLLKNNSLKTVPIIGYATGDHHTVTATLVDFFYSYRNLGDRYTDTVPVYYFEAIESVIEVLFVRLSDIVDSRQQNIGFNMKYYELARQLYVIYYTFGIDAIEHGKPELLSLSLSNLRRIIKPAKNFKLKAEQAEIGMMVIELAAKGIGNFGDITIKDKRSISDYALEIVSKHAAKASITDAVTQLKDNALLDKDIAVKAFIKRLQAMK